MNNNTQKYYDLWEKLFYNMNLTEEEEDNLREEADVYWYKLSKEEKDELHQKIITKVGVFPYKMT